MSDWASSAGHFYLPDGTPFYTVPYASGKGERAATLRDARKVGAYVGTTTVINCAAKPGLERWKLKQLALACLTLPRIEGESADAFLERAEADARAEAEKAKADGVRIHAALEQHWRGEPCDPDLFPWVKEAEARVLELCGEQRWSAERSFACSPYGYGGKVDLHSREWIIDWKGKDGELDDKTCALWDEHAMQGAAYRRGLRVNAKVAIGFVSRTRPQVRLVEIPQNDLIRGLAMFDALLTYWKIKNDYFPKAAS